MRTLKPEADDKKPCRKANREEKILARRFCQVCGHSASAHVLHTKGKFMGERGRCEYSRCVKCVGYVPKGWKPK